MDKLSTDQDLLLVKKNDSFTLGELRRLAATYHTYMTPHLGRKWRSDQAAAGFGVPLANITTTQSLRDTIDCPEYMTHDGVMTQITDCTAPRLVSHLTYHQRSLSSRFLENLRDEYPTPAQLHLKTAQRVLGDGVHIQSPYTTVGDALTEVSQILLEKGFPLYNRLVDSVGTVSPLQENIFCSDLPRIHRHFHEEIVVKITSGDATPLSGPLMSNNAGIVFDILQSLLLQKREGTLTESAYAPLFCGPSMIAYMKEKSRRRELHQMYKAAAVFLELPSHLEVDLIPLHLLEVLPHTGENHAIHILSEYLACRRDMDSLGLLMKTLSPEEREIQIPYKYARSKEATQLRQEYAAYLTQRAPFFHLDALSSGHRMATSDQQIPGIEQLTLSALSKLGPPPDHHLAIL